jgi:signal recognition particle subunit SRP54
MGMMPGMPKELKGAKIDDDDLKPIEAIIRSMTAEERAQPTIINGSRRQRIANGSGTEVGDVNRLVKQFGEMQKMMKKMGMGGPGGGRPGKGKSSKKGKGKKGRTAARPTGRGLPPGLGGPGGLGDLDLSGFPGMPNTPGMPGMPGAPRR